MNLVTLHDGGGSMVEAAAPVQVFGPYDDTLATAVVDALHQWIGQHPDSDVQQDWWAQVIELRGLTGNWPDPNCKTPEQAVAVVDRWYIETVYDEED